MRISDWSSDVCSSDLPIGSVEEHAGAEGNAAVAAPLLGLPAVQVERIDRPSQGVVIVLQCGLLCRDDGVDRLGLRAVALEQGVFLTLPDIDVFDVRGHGGCIVAERIGVELDPFFLGRNRDVDRPLRSQDAATAERSEEHTSELQSLMRISYAVFCLKKKK